MSMPSIPDITPNIDISLEKAVNLLLSSIAMEEISLSKLMDAESAKIKYVLDRQKCNNGNLCDVLSVNNSVNSSIINMSKMQMLLQWKLENVERLIPKPPCPPCPPPHPVKNCCGLVGRGCGKITCGCGEISHGEAFICAFVFASTKDNSLSYTAKCHGKRLSIEAEPNHIKICCTKDCAHEAVVTGKGKVCYTDDCGEDITGFADFRLVAWDDERGKKGIHMLITSSKRGKLIHDSGFVDGVKLRIV